MALLKTCENCIHWKGRTDLNKCKLKPGIIPNWSGPQCTDHKEMKRRS